MWQLNVLWEKYSILILLLSKGWQKILLSFFPNKIQRNQFFSPQLFNSYFILHLGKA